MCGIAGIISVNKNDVLQSRLQKMTDVIAHRGPDGEGHWISSNGNVALGHRRLSIIDLSHEADQPMIYLGRYTIVFNGEIYNYLELKDTLTKQGYVFTTASDTEVLMALYDRYKEKCLHLLDGMFSFVIYDVRENEIFATRDRFGEKPFFYSYVPGKHFLFGSEMKCLWQAGIEKKVNNRMLYNYLTYGHLDNPNDLSETFYENCIRLPHSYYIKLQVTTCTLTTHQYYDLKWRDVDYDITTAQAQKKFHELFYTSVSRRLRSDVPVGSSLSGGLDSSLVVAVIDGLKNGNSQMQKTFSAVFPGFKKDERKYVEHVIAAKNVSPHFITPGEDGLIASLDKLCWHQEEPFSSASIYVQYCVMQLAKQNNVTVLLDGQGADEILAGYHSYYQQYFNELNKTNKQLYQKEVKAYNNMHADNEINANVRGSFIERSKSVFGKQFPLLRTYYQKIKVAPEPFLNQDFISTYSKEDFAPPFNFSSLNESLYHSTFKQGLQVLLRYSDRNSMAHSVEVRLPFLYHEMVEFLFSLPPGMKINNGWTKWIMRQTFTQELPAEICWRKDKIGYEPPQKNWMDNDLFKSKIADVKQNLADNNILSKSFINKKNQADDNLDGKNWRLFMVGEII